MTLKKRTVAALIAIALLTTISMPKRSEATFGLVTGPASWVVVGGSLIGVAFVLGMLGAPGGLAFWPGVFLLDGEQGREVIFNEVSIDEAHFLNMSSEEVARYNDELEQVNAIRQDILVELAKTNEPTHEQARQLWNEMGKDLLSPEAFTATMKIFEANANRK